MRKAGSGPEEPRSSRGGGGGGSMWILAGAALLCPLSKLIILGSMGGALGGLLGNAWFVAGAFAAAGVTGWLGVRMVRKRLAQKGRQDLLRCGNTAQTDPDTHTTSSAREANDRVQPTKASVD